MTEARNDEWRYGYYATVPKNHRFLEAIGKLFAERDDWRCLDLGCGPGYLARYLADRLCPRGHVTGIEPDLDVLRRAQDRRTERLAFLAGVGQDLPFPDATFDWVISNSVLEHIPHAFRRGAIMEAARVTKRGGRCLLCVPTTLQKFWTLRCVGFHDKHVYGIRVRAADCWPPRKALAHWKEIIRLPWLDLREAYDLLPKTWLRLMHVPGMETERITAVCLFTNRDPWMRTMRAIERKYASAPLLRSMGTSLLVVLKKP